ncbi:cation/hydrogen exchanger 15, CATION/H+ EXCHANGER 15 [Hibiscus trionum]|uniref:Cation/hydrogen exchanger 15, CATION/H+ EXCHANGER 15 n=1 Tax=Hibiscus trionum TaxID=183268 RepID=A0A9W7I384_HIBTR|nr:cation/hydrogen exchanger 15, CATION/H+ EXCHANGER 15 [Hibiscus trionum]
MAPNATVMRHPIVCVLLNKNLHYNSMFWKKNPLDNVVPLFMLQVILSVVISHTLYFILRPLRQSKLVCNILAGIILGPSVLGRNKTYMETMFAPKEMVVLATMSNMAVYLFIFIVCIKMDTTMLTRATRNTWKLGLCCLIIPSVSTLSLTLWLQNLIPGIRSGNGFPFQFSVVSSVSYFIVITHALDELNLLCSELGQLSSSITMINEAINSVFVVIGVASQQQESSSSVYVVLSLCSLMMFASFVIRPILRGVIKSTPKGKTVKEGYAIAVILATFLLGVITDAIGASFATASIIMGLVIPDGPPLGATIVRQCELILFEFFLPLFFVRIGYFTDLTSIQDWKELLIFGGIFIAGCLGRIVACLLVSSSSNMRTSNAILLGLILSLQGVTELVQLVRWKHQRLIDDQTFATIVMGVVVINAIITPLIGLLYKPVVDNFDLPAALRLRNRSLVMTSVVGELRVITCVQEEHTVPSIISLLEAMHPKDVSPICAYVVHLVAAASQSVPTLAPYKNHLRNFSQPSSSDNIIRAFLNYTDHSQGTVQIQPFRMISPYKYMHLPICRLSETIHAPLIIMPFFNTQEAHDTDGSLRIFNTNIQAIAKCTVGVLVDRGLRSPISLTTFSYNMAVIFLGGADDREALSLATRASRQPNVRITVLRIDMIGNHNTLEVQIEREGDKTLFKDFKAMNVDNGCVACREVVAHDSEDVMKTLRSLSNTYDLIVVGKRHTIPELQALLTWAQYPELGVIGDALAAGRMSVLVLQQHGDGDASQRGFDPCGSDSC